MHLTSTLWSKLHLSIYLVVSLVVSLAISWLKRSSLCSVRRNRLTDWCMWCLGSKTSSILVRVQSQKWIHLIKKIRKLFLWSFLTCIVQTRWLWMWWIRGFLKDFSSFRFHFKDRTWRCSTACWLVRLWDWKSLSTNQTNLLLSDVLLQRNSWNTIFSKIKKKFKKTFADLLLVKPSLVVI